MDRRLRVVLRGGSEKRGQLEVLRPALGEGSGTHLREALGLSAVAGGALAREEPEGTAAVGREEARVSERLDDGGGRARERGRTGGARTSCETS